MTDDWEPGPFSLDDPHWRTARFDPAFHDWMDAQFLRWREWDDPMKRAMAKCFNHQRNYGGQPTSCPTESS
jgi:hypothetical protein